MLALALCGLVVVGLILGDGENCAEHCERIHVLAVVDSIVAAVGIAAFVASSMMVWEWAALGKRPVWLTKALASGGVAFGLRLAVLLAGLKAAIRIHLPF